MQPFASNRKYDHSSRGPLLFLALAIACLLGPASAFAQTSSTVTVNASSTLGTIPASAFGINTATWDPLMTDTALPPLLTALGINTMRYPGGSWSDDYHWQSNTGTANSGVSPNSNDAFDNFMVLVNAVGATPIITCNYGSNGSGTGGGDPTEAAAWVQYADVTKNYGVKYWEIGNEIYGNGYYSGSDWETDLHDTDTTAADRVGQASLSPEAYADNVGPYVSDMKAVDPTIKIGVVLNLPDGGNGTDWSTRVLAELQNNGTLIDFVILHWYPEYSGTYWNGSQNVFFSNDNDAQLLADPASIPGWMQTVHSWINQYCSNASNVQVFVTETNSDAGIEGKQMVDLVNGLFAADDYMTWLENGVSSVNWWDLHNGVSTDGDNSSSLYGTSTFGDEGILSLGQTPEPAAETPFAPYYGIQMLTHLGKPGDTMVTSTSSNSLLTTHAVLQASGNLALMLINKDPQNACTANVSLSGFVATSQGSYYQYGETTTSIAGPTSTTTGDTFSVTVPPYSLTAVEIPAVGVLTTFPAGLQMIAAPATYTGLSMSQYLNPSDDTFYVWQPSSGEYAETPTYPADTIRAGQGYWVTLASTTTLYNLGTLANTSKPVYIPLSAGWNMIGDPFNTSVPLTDVQVRSGGFTETYPVAASRGLVSSALYTWPAGWAGPSYQTDTTALAPFAGYWVWAKRASTLVVTDP